MTSAKILQALKAASRDDKRDFLPGFFQAYPGGYGEGDRFLGCMVPDQRKVAKQFRDLSRSELTKLLSSRWHECRLTGMFILVDQYQRAAKASNEQREADRRDIVNYYMGHLDAVNNWDIVDGTAPKILGPWLLDHPAERRVLWKLSKSSNLWERRIAVLATMPLIQDGQFKEFLKLANQLMRDEHDLMHKAIGWMLRELGKVDQPALEHFLEQHAFEMPRTMLRYAIEKMPKSEREHWMSFSA